MNETSLHKYFWDSRQPSVVNRTKNKKGKKKKKKSAVYEKKKTSI